MLALAVPGKLEQSSLITTVVEVPPLPPHVPGITNVRMLSPGVAPYRIGGGGTRSPYAFSSQCCSCRTGTTPGT